MIIMRREPIASSNLKSIGWKQSHVSGSVEYGTLQIEFLNGGVYEYEAVPRSVHTEITAAGSPTAPKSGPSAGQLFDSLVKKGGYAWTKVRDAAPMVRK